MIGTCDFRAGVPVGVACPEEPETGQLVEKQARTGKRGTFYAFAPAVGTGTTIDGSTAQRRDNLLELQLRDLLKDDLRIEPEVSRWFAVWGAPGL